MREAWLSLIAADLTVAGHTFRAFPHAQTNGVVTLWPTAKRLTSWPMETMVPTSSWPGTCGSEMPSSCPSPPMDVTAA